MKRLICIGSSGSLKDGGDYYYKNGEYPEALKKRAEDHAKALESIEKSELCYSVICPHNVTEGGENEVEVCEGKHNKSVSASALAKFLVSLVESAEFDPTLWLTALSSPGLTAYCAMDMFARPMPGQSLVVTSAAGAVGVRTHPCAR